MNVMLRLGLRKKKENWNKLKHIYSKSIEIEMERPQVKIRYGL